MELNPTLKQIDSLKQEADRMQPGKPELERVFWDKFRLEFNYNSNHMEGNTLTYGHTQILLKSGDVVGKYNIRELQEMKAHDLALKVIRESAEDPDFCLSQKFIKEINETILVEPFYNNAITPEGEPTQKLITPGAYKKTPNSVRLQNGEMFNYPSPEETPALMGDLIDWYEKESEAKEFHPVQLAAIFHYKMVRIHPFDDSNGRTSRLLMNYVLLRNGYAPLVIKSIDKKNYLIALNEADAGDIEAFVKYITSLQLHWQELFIKALSGKSIEEITDLSSETSVELKKELGVIEKTTTETFIPFLLYLEQKVSRFVEFFFESKIQIQGGGRTTKGNTISEIIHSPSSFANELLHSPDEFKILFLHRDLKKTGLRNWGYTTSVSLTCKAYEYRIEAEGLDEKITSSYKNQLSQEQYATFVEKIVAKEFLEIEKKLSFCISVQSDTFEQHS